jgi:hypothetical protein
MREIGLYHCHRRIRRLAILAAPTLSPRNGCPPRIAPSSRRIAVAGALIWPHQAHSPSEVGRHRRTAPRRCQVEASPSPRGAPTGSPTPVSVSDHTESNRQPRPPHTPREQRSSACWSSGGQGTPQLSAPACHQTGSISQPRRRTRPSSSSSKIACWSSGKGKELLSNRRSEVQLPRRPMIRSKRKALSFNIPRWVAPSSMSSMGWLRCCSRGAGAESFNVPRWVAPSLMSSMG